MHVYIAAPYTTPTPEYNVAVAMSAACRLINLGYVPFLPHLYHYLDQVYPQPYETWMRLCLAYVRKSDKVLRLPGTSPGADREVEEAQRHGIPVFFGTVDEFIEKRGWTVELPK